MGYIGYGCVWNTLIIVRQVCILKPTHISSARFKPEVDTCSILVYTPFTFVKKKKNDTESRKKQCARPPGNIFENAQVRVRCSGIFLKSHCGERKRGVRDPLIPECALISALKKLKSDPQPRKIFPRAEYERVREGIVSSDAHWKNRLPGGGEGGGMM